MYIYSVSESCKHVYAYTYMYVFTLKHVYMYVFMLKQDLYRSVISTGVHMHTPQSSACL